MLNYTQCLTTIFLPPGKKIIKKILINKVSTCPTRPLKTSILSKEKVSTLKLIDF